MIGFIILLPAIITAIIGTITIVFKKDIHMSRLTTALGIERAPETVQEFTQAVANFIAKENKKYPITDVTATYYIKNGTFLLSFTSPSKINQSDISYSTRLISTFLKGSHVYTWEDELSFHINSDVDWTLLPKVKKDYDLLCTHAILLENQYLVFGYKDEAEKAN